MFNIPILLLLSLPLLQVQPGDNLPVFSYINHGQVDSISVFLEDNDVNGKYGLDSITLLAYSIITNQDKVIRFLIEKGADINQPYLGTFPLMIAVNNNHIKNVKLLLENGADINAVDTKGNSVLMLAAGRGYMSIAKLLVKRGANIGYQNPRRDMAYDLAVRSNYPEVSKYLRDQYEKNLPDFRDGPFISWHNKKIKAYYLIHDSARQISRKYKQEFITESESFTVPGFAGDSMSYTIRKNQEIPKATFTNVSKIMTLGDIHGGYDSLVVFLRNNGVMDQDFNWTWGKGHLVFVGDIFDRGDKVTEALWLIYQLEEKARISGGAVHIILGNHEIMIFREETGYVSDKYYYLTKKVNSSYSWLFNKKSILGAWLRSRNTIIKIDDRLFVHAGISPELAFSGLTLEDINEIVRYTNLHPDRHPYGLDTEELIFGYLGPFWYRGYLEASRHFDRVTKSQLKNILAAYEVSSIFVGHTNVRKITSLYNKKIYTLDVPFYNYGYNMAGLLIEGNAIYLLNSSGEKVIME